MIYTHKSAVISACGLYRYLLTRTWDASKPRFAACGLNPSKADALIDDATVRVLVGRADRMGYGGLDLVNLLAYRATHPSDMMESPHPINEPGWPSRNGEVLAEVASKAAFFLACWGTGGSFWNRGELVLSALKGCGVPVHALRLNQDGSPAHPLRIGYDVVPFRIV